MNPADMANRRVVFVGADQVEVQPAPVPQPAAGEVTIATRLSLVSAGTELTVLSGRFVPQSFWSSYGAYPFLPGYSNIGVVQRVGEGVDPALRGTTVASYTAHAAYVTAPVEQVYRVPDGLAPEQAAFFTLAEIAMNGLRKATITWGESVAVFGLGPIGQVVVRLLLSIGVARVVAVDASAFRLGLLPDDPRIVRLPVLDADSPQRVREANRGRLVDCAIEATGEAALIPLELGCLRDEGRLLLLSSPRDKLSFDFHDHCNLRSYSLIGAHNSSHPARESAADPWTKQRHADLFFSGIQAGQLDFAPIVTHRVPFNQAPQTYAWLRSRPPAGVVLFDWASPPPGG